MSFLRDGRDACRVMSSLPKGVDYVTRMNLYNLIFRMVILIPFLTQPPHERTLTGRGSRVYPKGRGSRVRPGRGRRCARASPSRLVLRPRVVV